MNIQETVSIENPVETTENTANNVDIQEHLDMPVARANAVAFRRHSQRAPPSVSSRCGR